MLPRDRSPKPLQSGDPQIGPTFLATAIYATVLTGPCVGCRRDRATRSVHEQLKVPVDNMQELASPEAPSTGNTRLGGRCPG